MKLVHINLNEGILVDAINCTEWVIESPEYFSEYVMELAGQVEGKEGRFVLSDNEKEVDISKNVELIFNIFALDINEKKTDQQTLYGIGKAYCGRTILCENPGNEAISARVFITA